MAATIAARTNRKPRQTAAGESSPKYRVVSAKFAQDEVFDCWDKPTGLAEAVKLSETLKRMVLRPQAVYIIVCTPDDDDMFAECDADLAEERKHNGK
jgi:hypothetical protein